MTTTLYYTDTLSALSITGKVVRSMATSRGSGVVTKSQGSVTVLTAVFDTGSTPLCFAYQVGAYSATNAIYTFNHWGSESNAKANNYAGTVGVDVYTAAGVFRFALAAALTNTSSEYGTSPAARSVMQYGNAQTINDGDWIVVNPAHYFSSGATGYTDTFSYNGTSAAANGDSYMTSPDTIAAYSAGGGAAVLAGTAASSSAGTAGLTTAIQLVGTGASTSAGTGALTTAIQFVATAASTSAASAGLTTAIRLVGTADSTSATTADLTTGAAGAILAGTAASASTGAGALTTGIRFVGVAASASATSAALTTEIRLAGAAASVSAASATTLTGIAAVLSGTAAGTSAAGAGLTTAIRLAASAASTSAGSGALTTAIRLVGTAASVSATTAALTAAGAGAVLAGSVAATSAASAGLTASIRLVATVTATAGATGTLLSEIVTAADQPHNASGFFMDPSAARVVRAAGWGVPPYTLTRAQQAEQQREADALNLRHQQRLVEDDWLLGLISDQEYVRRAI
jgi:hypothetical protein